MWLLPPVRTDLPATCVDNELCCTHVAAGCLQLADDFAELVSATPTPGEPDELNLVYVALSRAMLGLVCNRDLAELVTAQSRKELAVEVREPCMSREQPWQPYCHHFAQPMLLHW